MAERSETLLERARREKVGNDEFLEHLREQRAMFAESGDYDHLERLDKAIEIVERLGLYYEDTIARKGG